jgi:small-conductance mechanosensitive channel
MDLTTIRARAEGFLEQLLVWLQSPAFLAQVGAIVVAIFVAPIIAKKLKTAIPFFRDPPADDASLYKVRDILFRASTFLRAVILVGLLAVFAAILAGVSSLGENWLVKIAQSLATVFLVYRAIKTFVADPLYQKVAVWVLVPLALVIVLGYFDDLTAFLDGIRLNEDSNISLLAIIRLALFGGLFFWLGNLGNARGQNAIRSQDSLDVGAREILAKLFQIIIFGIVVVMAFGAAGIPLSGLAVAFGAVGLGIGLGLQPVAANFVSGLIILLDRSVRVGDFISLEDGREGFVEAINMRSTTVETTDGKDIMVPNTVFIENAYENWTHKDPRQRYEVYFSVGYDTDIDRLEDIIIPAINAHPSVLQEPEQPDLELREFGESGINFAVEFWCEGIDDGPNKFTSDLNFAIWRALRDAGIAMPLPQRVIHQVPVGNVPVPPKRAATKRKSATKPANVTSKS